MQEQNENLRRYFLGDLSETESDEIELRLISDADFEGDMIEAETELVEDYLDGALSDSESKLFEENYLVTPERRKNVQESAMLHSFARQKMADGGTNADIAVRPGLGPVSLLDRIRAVFPLPVAAAAILLIAAVLGYFFLLGGGPDASLQTEYTALNRQDLSDLDKFRSMPGFTALPGNLRGGGGAAKLTGLSGESVFVRLALPVEWKDKHTVSVRLLRSNSPLLVLDPVRTYANTGGAEIRLLLPVKLLSKGSYRIEAVVNEPPSTMLVSYDFSVE